MYDRQPLSLELLRGNCEEAVQFVVEQLGYGTSVAA